MTWEEMTKKYERESRVTKTGKKAAGLDHNWEKLVRSTDKLLWLFALSNKRRGPVKGG